MRILFLFLCLALLGQNNLSAQQKFTSGAITYGISLEGDNPMAGMFEGSYMKLIFDGESARVDMNMMSGMIDMITVTTPKNGVILVSAMGKKIASKLTKKDIQAMKEQQEKQPQLNPDDIEIFKDEKETVAGYSCHLVRVKNPALDSPMELYVTEDIQPANPTQVQKQFPGLKGMPLMYKVNAQGMNIVFKAKEINPSKPDKSLFKVAIPKGYEMMTYDELQKSGGGMMGM